MANDTLDQNESTEKAIHERIHTINIKIIALKHALDDLCKLILKAGFDKDKVLTIEEITHELNKAQLQLNYYDDIIQDRKQQQKNEPLIVKEDNDEIET